MPPPARILYLTTSGQVGGAERCLLSIIRGLDPGRFASRVLIGSGGLLPDLLAEQQIDARVVPLPPALRRLSRYHGTHGLAARLQPFAQAPAYLRRLRRAGQEWAPRIVHSNGAKMHYASAWLKPAWDAALLWHLHDFPGGAGGSPAAGIEPAPREPIARRLAGGLHRRIARRVDLAVATSRAVADAYREREPWLGSKLRVVPNGVDVAAMQGGDGGEIRARLGWGPQTFVIGMVAIFAPWKGQEVFLRAAGRLHRQTPEVRFLLAGDDIYDTGGHGGGRRRLEGLARELGLEGVVAFPGFVRDIASAYAALDVMVHASTRPEPFGRTVIEAMAAGVPVVGAAAGGVVEILEDGVSGLLTRPGDVDDLAAALLRLFQSHDLRRSLAEHALRRVEGEFSEAAIGRRMARLYEELLQPEGERRAR